MSSHGKHEAREERRRRVLQAGESALTSMRYEWAKALTFDRLEAGTGIDRRQIERDFGTKHDLAEALVDHHLRFQGVGSEDFDGDELLQMLTGNEVDFGEGLRFIGWMIHLKNLTQLRLRRRMMFFGFMLDVEETHDALRRLYETWDVLTQMLIFKILEDLLQVGVRHRVGLSAREFAIVLVALFDGLAIRASLDPELVADDLSGRVLEMFAAAWLDSEQDGLPLAEPLSKVDEVRRQQAGSSPKAESNPGLADNG